MRHPMYERTRNATSKPGLVDRFVQGAEKTAQVAAAARSVYEIGRGIYTAGRYLAPLLALA